LGSEKSFVAVTTAVPLTDLRRFLVGFVESASDKGAEGGGGVGSVVFGFETASSSEDESELEPEDPERSEPETPLLCFAVITVFVFPLTFTSISSSLSLELEPELEELSLDPFFFVTVFSLLVFTSSSLSLELESPLSSLLSAVFGKFIAPFLLPSSSESASESGLSLEPNVLLDRSGDGCFFAISFPANATGFVFGVEDVALLLFLVVLELSVEDRMVR